MKQIIYLSIEPNLRMRQVLPPLSPKAAVIRDKYNTNQTTYMSSYETCLNSIHITTCTGEIVDVIYIYIYISGPLPKWENYAVSHTAAIVSSSLYKAQSITWKQVP